MQSSTTYQITTLDTLTIHDGIVYNLSGNSNQHTIVI